MPSPCNNVNVFPIKVSQLVRYSNLDGDDLLLTVESGSSLLSRRSTVNDLKNSLGRLTGSYSGSFTGSFKGEASGSFSGSYWGRVISKNTKATGSFSGSHWGSLVSKNTKATGSFSGSHWGSLVSKNTVSSGSFSGSYWGRVVSKNTKATGSFSGTNSKLSGSFSGSYLGSLVSKNAKITGSFRGVNNITNFRGTGKNVSVNATSSYSVYTVSSSYAQTASYMPGGGAELFTNASYVQKNPGAGIPSNTGTSNTFGSIVVPTGKTLKWFKIEGSFNVSENNGVQLNGVSLNGTLVSTNVYSSWGWTKGYYYNPDSGDIITHFTIEGAPPSAVTTGTIPVVVHTTNIGTNTCNGYAVGYF
jgi:hypothetical protein